MTDSEKMECVVAAILALANLQREPLPQGGSDLQALGTYRAMLRLLRSEGGVLNDETLS